MRKLMLFVILALCPLIARADEWTHNYAVNGKPELVVDANDADVEITVGTSQQVEARVITHGLTINNDLKITDTQNGNRVELRLHKSKHLCFGYCSYGIRVELQVPHESDLNIHTGDGNIRVNAVKGNLQLESGDGNVRLSDVEGSLRTDTHDGNINVRGKLDLLNLRTGDGDIDAEVAEISPPQPGWMLRSGDGNITLRLPSDFRADIDAHTGDGHLEVDIPIATTIAGREHSIAGKINGGGIPIELRTGDGDIRLRKM